MSLNLENRVSQKLSAKTLQYLGLLQLNSEELMERLESLALENPVLELGETGPERAADWERLAWLSGQNAPRGGGSGAEDGESCENGLPWSPGETLFEHVCAQLDASREPAEVKRAAVMLAGCLDGRGYLDASACRDVSSALGDDAARRGLALLQSCSPAGLGARSVGECILLQLRAMDADTSLAERIAESRLDSLAGAHYAQIARALGVRVDAVYETAALIRSLSPYPGSAFAPAEQAAYIYPDFYVDGDLNVHLCFPRQPQLSLSGYYASLFRSTEDSEVREYLDAKLRQARWVMDAVEKRSETLLRCAGAIVSMQEEFFTSASGRLAPLKQRDIARLMGCHESTVSRAVRGKYLQCARGCFPLSHFFTAQASAPGTPELVSADGVKRCIAELIGGEDRSGPLSDEALSSLLAERGIRVSRRTVAKYRSELGIPNTSARRAAYWERRG